MLFLEKMAAMGENKIVGFVTAGLLLITAVFFYTIPNKAEDNPPSISSEIEVEQTWKLPAELKEISAIAFLEDDKLACIQDEEGVIYVFNLKSSKIENKISFAKKGDFEGIAVHENTIFVLRSDGTIFRITNYKSDAKTEIFDTPFTTENDMEGLFYDDSTNRLLISPKEQDLESKEYKGIYAINPESMEMNDQAVIKMTFKEDFFKSGKKKEKKSSFFPSEINKNPKTGEIYVLEAREPRLLILDSHGKPKHLYRLDQKVFPQPEGLAFDASGNLYISSEGDPGVIHLVKINQK